MRHALIGLALATGCERPSRVVRTAELTLDRIEAVERGVVVLESTWSAPAMAAQQALLDRLEDEPITIVIVPSDAASLARFGLGPSGAGEQLWVHHGRVCVACAGLACIERGLAWLRDPADCPQPLATTAPFE